ncbi:MAG TPA: GNAT family N-acetyltransferase [Thermohalobaculum sp.]|nr:GNAT family N-acetyltransferase [Thermohalobaculum sp.]
MIDFLPPEGVTLRRARPGDFAFAEALYLSSTRPLLTALGAWDEEGARTRLRAAFDRHPPLVIRADGEDVGWVQVSVRPGAIHLHQIHLDDAWRNRGIGSRLIGDIMRAARKAKLPVTLNVIHGNPAVELYKRLDFVIVNTGRELLQMRWQEDGPDAAAATEPPPASQT